MPLDQITARVEPRELSDKSVVHDVVITDPTEGTRIVLAAEDVHAADDLVQLLDRRFGVKVL